MGICLFINLAILSHNYFTDGYVSKVFFRSPSMVTAMQSNEIPSEILTLTPSSPIDTLFSNRGAPNFGSRSGQSSFFEEDINFCLRETDTAMSAQSRSKILNEITNNVMKALIIGYEPIILQLHALFEGYRDQIDKAECVYDESEVLENVCESITIEECDIKWKQGSKNDFCVRDLLMARIYLDRLSSLLLQGFTQDTVLGGIYN